MTSKTITTNRFNSEDIFITHLDGAKKGVWLNMDRKEKEPINIYISSLIFISEKIQAENVQYYLIKWDTGTEIKEKYISASNLFSDSFKDNESFKYLIDNGLMITPKSKSFLIEYLKAQATTAHTELGTNKLGWNIEENEFYSNGLTTNPQKRFVGKSGFKFIKKGNLEEYRDKIGRIFAENPLVFAICSYSASSFILPLLQNETNQALQLNGISSKGKSGVINLALSLFTAPDKFYGFNNTKGSIFNILKSNNHHPICFDEVGESNMKLEEKINLLYALANGIERGRLKKNDSLNDYETTASNEEEKLKYTVLIAGEKSFLDGIKREGTGIDARYIEILLPENTPLWDSINTPEEAETLMIFLKRNHGFLAEFLIEQIKQDGDNIIKQYGITLSKVRDEFKEASPIVKRKIRILAYSYVTSIILARFFYEEDDEQIASVTENAFEAFKSAILYEIIDESANDIYKEALSHIQDTLFKYLEDETMLDSNQAQLTQKLGFIKINNVCKEIAIISSKFTNVCQLLGLDERLFMSYLKEKNLLITDKGVNTKKIMKNGSRANYYLMRIPTSFFLDEEEKEILNEKDMEFLENSPWGKQ